MWAVVGGARAPGTAHLSSEPGSEAGGRLCLASISALSLLSTQPLLVTTKTRPRAHQASEHTYQRKKTRQYVNILTSKCSVSLKLFLHRITIHVIDKQRSGEK